MCYSSLNSLASQIAWRLQSNCNTHMTLKQHFKKWWKFKTYSHNPIFGYCMSPPKYKHLFCDPHVGVAFPSKRIPILQPIFKYCMNPKKLTPILWPTSKYNTFLQSLMHIQNRDMGIMCFQININYWMWNMQRYWLITMLFILKLFYCFVNDVVL